MFLEIDSLEKRGKIIFNQGKIVATGIPKYDLVTTHDCRRSFITNLLDNGFSRAKKYLQKI